MVNYYKTTVWSYNNEKDKKKNINSPKWNHIFLWNYNINNFYFLIDNFFYENKNMNSLFVANTTSSDYSLYKNINDEKLFLPSHLNQKEKENSYLNDFLYLRDSSFIKFFINNMIDVPICFKKSKSLKNKNFELPLLKFINFLMKKGKKEKLIITLFQSFRLFFKNLKNTQLNFNENSISWLTLYFFIFNTNNNFNESSKSFFFKIINNNDININLSYNNIFFNKNKTLNTSFFLKNYLYFLLTKVSPIFSYFIYSVDKNIKKYSRGKSGKYTFIWKYVAPFKRTKLTMRWVAKDIKFLHHKKFNERLIDTFNNLLTNPDKSFAWKSKNFSHNYVFKNFRKSLLSSLKTTS